MRKHLLILLTIFAFILLGTMMEKSPLFENAKKALQKITIPSPPLQFGKRGAILEKIGRPVVFPNDYSRFMDPKTGLYTLNDITSVESSDPHYAAQWRHLKDIPLEQYPSSVIMDKSAVARGIPILSLVVAEFDLYDPQTGIFANPNAKGKSWERPCFVSYYDKGELQFVSGAGIRIHSRHKGRPEILPVRFYFRNVYGHDQFKPGILFGAESIPIRHVIARRELNYRSTLAMDLAKRIGCIVPDYSPAAVYLNGKPYGDCFVLIEHINDKWLRSHFGHDNFVFLQTQGSDFNIDNNPDYEKLLRWVNDHSFKMTLAEAAKRVDVENMCRWFLSQLFTAGYDEYQGPVVLDKSKPGTKWFWINWDMDGSIDNNVDMAGKKIWEDELQFKNLMTNPPRNRNDKKVSRYKSDDPRVVIFQRLYHEDPDFKPYFERLFMEVMNHKLSPSFLREWLGRWSGTILSIRPAEQSFVEEKLYPFITHRPAFLRELMRKYFGSTGSVAVSVEGLDVSGAVIDGFRYDGAYSGRYFEGATIRIALNAEPAGRIEYWLINGEKVVPHGALLTYTVQSTTVIRPIFKQQ